MTRMHRHLMKHRDLLNQDSRRPQGSTENQKHHCHLPQQQKTRKEPTRIFLTSQVVANLDNGYNKVRSNSFSKTHNVQNHSNLLLQGTYEHFILNKSEHNNNENELLNKQPSEAILLNTEIVNIINNEECDDFDHTLLIDSGASHSCLNNREYFVS